MANPDQIHIDSNNRPVGAGLDPATGKSANLRMTNVTQATDGEYYGDLVVAQTGGGFADTIATGNLTAAQATAGTPVAGGTVSITLGEGQATVEAQLTGTFSNGTTVLFEGTDDTGTTTNWYATFGQDTTVANPTNISSVAGPGPYLVRIPSAGYQQIRVRCTPYHAADNVAVRLIASVAGTSSASLSTNDGTFAKETGGNLATLVTQTLTPNVSDRWTRQVGQVDLARVLGSALSASNPNITESNISNWVRNGQGFYANTEYYASSAANNAFSIFNPVSSGKIIIVYSLMVIEASTSNNSIKLRITNTNPSFANTMGASAFNLGNTDSGSVTSPIASVTYATASTAVPSLSAASLAYYVNTNVTTGAADLFSGGKILKLVAGTGLACYLANASGNNVAFGCMWTEY